MAALTYRTTGGIVTESLDVSTSVQRHQLGSITRDHLGREWMYVRANGAVTGQGYVCDVDASYDSVLLTTAIANTMPNFLGACGTNGAPADNDYFWLCLVKPPGDTEMGIRTSASAAADTQLYTTATAGELDDATGTAPIDNVRLLTATGGSAAVNTASEWNHMKRGLIGT